MPEQHDALRLDQFLKFQGIVGTGGQAKLLIQDGQVRVNGQIETRRRRKRHFIPAIIGVACTMLLTMVLTRDYLLDVFQLESDRQRHFQWIVQAVGHAFPEAGEGQVWTSSRDLQGYLSDCDQELSLSTNRDWSVTVVQTSGGANREFSGLGERWFE